MTEINKMPMGVKILLQSLGIKPDEIIAKVDSFGQIIAATFNRISAIEAEQRENRRLLLLICEAQGIDATPPENSTAGIELPHTQQ